MPTVNDIIRMEQEFLRINKRSPTKLYLTLADETDLFFSACQHLGDQTSKAVTSAGRLKGLFPKIHDMEVIYESDKTGVE